MGTLYIDTGGATTNSGSTDQNAANLTGTNATVAGSVVTLDGSPDLSGLSTSGSTQSTIHLSQATNANMKIFWITAVDNGAKTVTVHAAPTGVTGSAWSIGGRHVLTNASIEGALRAGDTAIFNNSPASSATRIWTFRNSGSNSAGQCKIKGKTGVRPVLTTTGVDAVIRNNSQTLTWVENLELVASDATGLGYDQTGSGDTVYNVKVSDAGSNHGIRMAGSGGYKIIGCEVSGSAGDGVNLTLRGLVFGCYIHDNTGDGIEYVTANGDVAILNNVIDTNTGRGIYHSAGDTSQSQVKVIAGNTIYGNLNSGLEITDADSNISLVNNLFHGNGDAAGESNVEWAAGNALYVSFHAWNVLYDDTAADAPINFTVNEHVASSEFTTDPAMGAPATGDFTPGASGSAKAAGFPGVMLGGDTGYLDIGAIQRQEPAGGGGLLIHPGMGGGING